MTDTSFIEAAAADEAIERVPKRIGLSEMWDVASDLAFEIETGQNALVLAGIRPAPYAPAMRRASVLVETCRLIERLRSRPDLVRQLFAAPPTRAASRAAPR